MISQFDRILHKSDGTVTRFRIDFLDEAESYMVARAAPQHGYVCHSWGDLWVSVESGRDDCFPVACLPRHEKGQLAVGFRLVVLRVLEQETQNVLAPAARSGGVIRGSMRVGLGVTQWTGPLFACLYEVASASLVPPTMQRDHRTTLKRRHICHGHSDGQVKLGTRGP